MLKASLIAIGLVLGATSLASAQTDRMEHHRIVPRAQHAPLIEGRSVYVSPVATEPQNLRPNSFSREVQEEESSSNISAN